MIRFGKSRAVAGEENLFFYSEQYKYFEAYLSGSAHLQFRIR